jgi:precorrin-2 C20-methyltransferase/precorrin-3B C17-methyltransferase
VLTVLPGTLPGDELARRLAGTDAAAVLKLGRTFGSVRAAAEAAGVLDRLHYAERVSTGEQRLAPLGGVDPDEVPYFSLAVLPSPLAAATTAREAASTAREATATARDATATAPSRPASGEVVVVGLGPAGRAWLTPEAQAALAEATDLVGYGPYLERVPANPRQRRHPSGNRVEAERAAFALGLGRDGARVAVVSSGDPGVFAMAAAVLEVASEPAWKDVPVRVLPGLTAAHAVASRVGAPLGHDYCVLSLSDRLKPWPVIAARLRATAAADLALAIYNPASRTRTWQLRAARDLLLEHRAPDTPVVIGRDVGGAGERIAVHRLAELDPAEVDMRCLLLIGSSQTRIAERGDGGQVVFTPRRYPG